MRKVYICFFIIGIIGFISCRKDDVLPRDKMIAVLHDIQIAEAIQSIHIIDFGKREDKDALVEGVLMKHGITQAQLDSSLVWYSDNVEIYKRVNDSVIATLKREHNLATERLTRYELLTNIDKKSNLLPDYFYLTEATPITSFTIDSFTIARLYPDFMFQFKALWVDEDTDAELTVAFKYTDTTIIESQRLLPVDSILYKVEKPAVQDTTLKRIDGFIRLNNYDTIDQRILLYDIKVRDKIQIETDTTSTDSIKNRVAQ